MDCATESLKYLNHGRKILCYEILIVSFNENPSKSISLLNDTWNVNFFEWYSSLLE